MRTKFINARIIQPTGVYEGEVVTDGGKILEVALGGHALSSADRLIDAEGRYLSPGFIEVHSHGAGGYDFMDGSAEAIYGACRTHMEHGTTSILPTTITSTRKSLMDFVDLFNTLELEKEGYPNILGFHLEGPYFAESQKGAQDPKYLRNPDPDEYMAVLNRTDRLRRWSFAIELPGAEGLLAVLRERGIISSLAHSDADLSQVYRAYENGMTALTHFYSCMTTVRRVNAFRVAGAIEAGYLLDDLYVEVIADGCHLPEELLSLIYKIKGPEKICLVTDSIRAAGMPDGEYRLGGSDDGLICIKEDGVAKLPDRSAFAGSVATSDRLVRTFRQLTGAPLYEVVKMASYTPARLLGIGSRKGTIGLGKDADLLLFDDDIQISMVMVRGDIVGQNVSR